MEDLFRLLSPSLTLEIPPLPPEQQELLRQQEIGENEPGTILRDFQTLLDLIGLEGIEVSGVHNLFPMKVLPELNERLSHPISIDLKRPQQKSYPYINGLYLLLRASGFSTVKRQGKKQLLILDETVLQSWVSLNPTERYFTLLETWMIWGNEEILGGHDSVGNLLRCIRFWPQIPDRGLKIKKYTDQHDFGYFPGLHNLALLDLFGCLSIQHGKPEPGKGWRINRLQRLPFGDALLQCLLGIFTKKELHWQNEGSATVTFGELQLDLQPLFPQWQNNLVIPRNEFQDGIYVFTVSLGKVWRRIAIPATLELDWLSSTILKAFNFDNDHLYRFTYKDRSGCSLHVHHPYMDEPPFTSEVCIGDLPLQVGSSMTYLFDFGDNWEFDVRLEEIQPPNAKIKKPKILETHGKAPEQYPNWDEEE